MKEKDCFVICFNTGEYWGGFRKFTQVWWKANLYRSVKIAEREAKRIIHKYTEVYLDTGLVSYSILEVHLFLKDLQKEDK